MPYVRDMPSVPDYDAPETLVVDAPEQLRAMADEVRSAIIALLRDRAYSTQELAAELGIPKGTVGHHLKVLESAGLIRVVRTRQVRAMTEKFWGRTARLFLFSAEDPADARALAASVLRQAASEVDRSPAEASFGHVRASLSRKDAARLERRLPRLFDDFRAAEVSDGAPHALAAVIYERGRA
jgi:DNA-binding transcriptional ArsR family regulator